MYPEAHAILVIDHDDTRRCGVETILREEGFPVSVVTEGLSGLRAIARREFSLVVAAMKLPGTLDGITTMRQARVRHPTQKFLFVAEGPLVPLRLNRDADDVIAAPFHRWELLGCVFELLQRDVTTDSTDLARRARTFERAS